METIRDWDSGGILPKVSFGKTDHHAQDAGVPLRAREGEVRAPDRVDRALSRCNNVAVSLSSFFGPLEIQALEALWSVRRESSVRDLRDFFPGVAYTTLMTTLDRLYKKGVLSRRKAGRAFLYAPLSTREDLEQSLAFEALDAILGSFGTRSGIRPLLSTFVDAVSRRDEIFLDELEALVRARRRSNDREEAS